MKNIEKEIWIACPHSKTHEISNYGETRSLNHIVNSKGKGKRLIIGRIIKKDYSDRYFRITLHQCGKKSRHLVHRLVAEAFVENPDNKPHVNHKDGNKRNNHYSNLEWVTPFENMQHARDTGLKVTKKGKDNPMYGRYGANCNRSRPVKCISNGMIFASAQDAEINFGICKDGVARVCRGVSKSAKKLEFEYI